MVNQSHSGSIGDGIGDGFDDQIWGDPFEGEVGDDQFPTGTADRVMGRVFARSVTMIGHDDLITWLECHSANHRIYAFGGVSHESDVI